MRSVHLYGDLATEFGPRFDLDVRSIAEAVRALEANFPGQFHRSIRDGAYHLIVGKNTASGESVGEDLLRFRFGSGDFHILPAVAGAGGDNKGVIQTVIGVALIATSLAVGLPTPVGAFNLTFADVARFGVNLALKGVSSLLTPTPKAPDLASTASLVENQPSFFFSGPVNVIDQGGPVPLVYGRIRVGSTVISSGIDTVTI